MLHKIVLVPFASPLPWNEANDERKNEEQILTLVQICKRVPQLGIDKYKITVMFF